MAMPVVVPAKTGASGLAQATPGVVAKRPEMHDERAREQESRSPAQQATFLERFQHREMRRFPLAHERILSSGAVPGRVPGIGRATPAGRKRRTG
jgi:hypothetical protein